MVAQSNCALRLRLPFTRLYSLSTAVIAAMLGVEHAVVQPVLAMGGVPRYVQPIAVWALIAHAAVMDQVPN